MVFSLPFSMSFFRAFVARRSAFEPTRMMATLGQRCFNWRNHCKHIIRIKRLILFAKVSGSCFREYVTFCLVCDALLTSEYATCTISEKVSIQLDERVLKAA